MTAPGGMTMSEAVVWLLVICGTLWIVDARLAPALSDAKTKEPRLAAACLPPTEHEVLLIGVAQRKDGELVITGCTHAAGKSAYFRRGMQ